MNKMLKWSRSCEWVNLLYSCIITFCKHILFNCVFILCYRWFEYKIETYSLLYFTRKGTRYETVISSVKICIIHIVFYWNVDVTDYNMQHKDSKNNIYCKCKLHLYFRDGAYAILHLRIHEICYYYLYNQPLDSPGSFKIKYLCFLAFSFPLSFLIQPIHI